MILYVNAQESSPEEHVYMYKCTEHLQTLSKESNFSLSRDKVIKHKAPSFLSFYKGPNPLPWTVAEIYHYTVICHAAPGVVREVKTHYEHANNCIKITQYK